MSKKISEYGLLIALAFIFSYIEAIIPFDIKIPGIKLGLANIVVMISLYKIGTKDAAVISIVRILLTGFTFGNAYSMLYSISGGGLSFIAMSFGKKSGILSFVGVSILGGVTHNIGQIAAAVFVTKIPSIYLYLPVLMTAGIITGVLTGILGANIIKRIR